MKTRIEFIYRYVNCETALKSVGYTKHNNLFEKDGTMYKIAWAYFDGDYVKYIDLIEYVKL